MARAGQPPVSSTEFHQLPTEVPQLVAEAERAQIAGRLAEAAEAYRKILALRPDVAEDHNNFGNILWELGRVDEALERYQQALALRPDFAEAHYNLGNVLRTLGKLQQAAARFEQAIALRPNFAEAYNSLGAVLTEQDQLQQAAARFEQAIALRPDCAGTYCNLGNVLRRLGQLDQAVARLQQALALSPDLAEAHDKLGSLFRDQGKLAEATAHFEQALALKPSLLKTRNDLGCVLRQLGRFDEALARFDQTLALQPDFVEAHHNIGNVLKDQGKLDEAVAHYDLALALRPDYAQAHYNRSTLKTFRPGDPDLAALETLAADTSLLAPGKMLYIHFALGKALEDVGEHQRAFEHWRQGNALKRGEVDYDEAACLRDFRFITDLFDSSLMNRLGGAGDPSAAPIFVLGMPRSGSTLVEQILASHPQVQAAGELKNLDRVARSVRDAGGRPIPFLSYVPALDAESQRQLGQAYLASLPALPDGKQRITDKALGNFLYVGLIRLILPNARIIHTLRDPVDTCLSCYSRLFPAGVTFSYDLAELGRYYRGYHALMAHWRSVLPAGAMLDVAYEDVVDNLEQQARRLIDYCGLPWDDRCLSFHQTRRPIATASSGQVRRPIYRSSLARWRRYAADLQPLLAELESCRPAR